MTLNLMLLRHAKSDWRDPGLDDHDRPLAPRGIAAARAMGQEIARRNLVPSRVLCSSALRARQTWQEASPAFDPAPPVETVEALYDFGDGDALLEAIHALGGTSSRLMLICHNPAIEQLARRLTGQGDPELRRRMRQKFPTAALAVLSFESATWPEVHDSGGTLLSFIRPRDAGGPAGD